jgi:hypothetical protein
MFEDLISYLTGAICPPVMRELDIEVDEYCDDNLSCQDCPFSEGQC